MKQPPAAPAAESRGNKAGSAPPEGSAGPGSKQARYCGVIKCLLGDRRSGFIENSNAGDRDIYFRFDDLDRFLLDRYQKKEAAEGCLDGVQVTFQLEDRSFLGHKDAAVKIQENTDPSTWRTPEQERVPDPSRPYTGRVKTTGPKFIFIVCPDRDGNDVIFYPSNEVQFPTAPQSRKGSDLKQNDTVKFDVVTVAQGLQAINVLFCPSEEVAGGYSGRVKAPIGGSKFGHIECVGFKKDPIFYPDACRTGEARDLRANDRVSFDIVQATRPDWNPKAINIVKCTVEAASPARSPSHSALQVSQRLERRRSRSRGSTETEETSTVRDPDEGSEDNGENLFMRNVADSRPEPREGDPDRSDSEGDDHPHFFLPEKEDKLLKEMETVKRAEVMMVRDLLTLVRGTVRVTSGTDFTNHRCRCEVTIDEGPKALLGLLVHIRGEANRNRAFHFDKVWVRIFHAAAYPEDGQSQETKAWDRSMAWSTRLLGNVVLAEEAFETQRHTRMVCVRTRIVRRSEMSTCLSMTFRPLNGKFPLLHYTCPEEEGPSCPIKQDDLYEAQLDPNQWQSQKLPEVSGVKPLYMSKSMNDRAILNVVKTSINLSDWREEDLLDISSQADDREPDIPSPAPALETRGGLQDLSKAKHHVIAVEHRSWPASMAFTLLRDRPDGDVLLVHIIDVDHYLAKESEEVKKRAREKAVGVWYLDFRDEPAQAALPLFTDNLDRRWGFQEGESRYAVTFEFKETKGKHGSRWAPCDSALAKHYRSFVRCDQLLEPKQAEQILRQDPQADTGKMLKHLVQKVAAFEDSLASLGEWAFFDHLEPRLRVAPDASAGSDSCSSALPPQESLRPWWRRDVPQTAPHREYPAEHISSLLAALNFMVNNYAGTKLNDPALWAVKVDAKRAKAKGKVRSDVEVMPVLRNTLPGPSCHHALLRLANSGSLAKDRVTGVTAADLVKALKEIVEQPHLSFSQRRALHQEFHRKVKAALPYADYRLVDQEVKPCEILTRAQIFHVSAPLMRYMDIVGLRVLKSMLGFGPPLDFKYAELEDIVQRTNVRSELLSVARTIHRSVSMMKELGHGGRRVAGAVLGEVGPVNVEVIVPFPGLRGSWTHKVPVSAFKSLFTTTEWKDESKEIEVKRKTDKQESTLKLQPWGGGHWDLTCVVMRNYASPIFHHASPTAVILSDLSFILKQDDPTRKPQELRFGIGHKRNPEVFSTWPNLEKYYKLDTDLDAYVDLWHRVRQCQVHAGAVLKSTEQRHVVDSVLFREDMVADTFKRCPVVSACNRKHHLFACTVTMPYDFVSQSCQGKSSVESALAIIRGSTKDGLEVLLYGIVREFKEVKTKGKRFKREICHNTPTNPSILCTCTCSKAHSYDELRGPTYDLEVGLSCISAFAYLDQLQIMNSLQEPAAKTSYEVEFIPVARIDRNSFEMLKEIKAKSGLADKPPLHPCLPQRKAPQPMQLQCMPTSDMASKALEFEHIKVMTMTKCSKCSDIVQELPREVRSGKKCSFQGCSKAAHFGCHNTGCRFHLCEEHSKVKCRLNDTQKKYCQTALEQPFYIVQGPPGTGKTTFIIHLIAALLNLKDGSLTEHPDVRWTKVGQKPTRIDGNILVCTPSNQAADQVAERLLELTNLVTEGMSLTRVYCRSIEASAGSIFGQVRHLQSQGQKHIIPSILRHHSLHYRTRYGSDEMKRLGLQLEGSSETERKSKQMEYDSKYKEMEKEVVRKSQIVVTTCGATASHTSLEDQNFTTVIIDEAAQATEPEVLAPALKAESRLVLAGDHKQLYPVIVEESLCKAYKRVLETSFLQRQLDRKPPPPNNMLEHQYRMHPEMSDFVNQTFYNGELKDDSTVLDREPAPTCVWGGCKSVMFINCVHPYDFGKVGDGTSCSNVGEAKLVADICERLFEDGVRPAKIGILTPYKAQEQVIKEDPIFADKEVTIGTVNCLQGAERDYIILSLVRSTGAFLTECSPLVNEIVEKAERTAWVQIRQALETSIGIVNRKELLNVALTRGRLGLIIIGNCEVLGAGSQEIHSLIEFHGRGGSLVSEAGYREFLEGKCSWATLIERERDRG